MEEIVKLFPNAKSVVLFGSYARKEQKEYSDIDVLVISNEKIDKKKIMFEFFERHRKILSIIHLTEKEFFDLIQAGNPQLLVIFLEGKVLKDDGTFERGKNLYKALWGKEIIIVKYGGKTWSTEMLNYV